MEHLFLYMELPSIEPVWKYILILSGLEQNMCYDYLRFASDQLTYKMNVCSLPPECPSTQVLWMCISSKPSGVSG